MTHRTIHGVTVLRSIACCVLLLAHAGVARGEEPATVPAPEVVRRAPAPATVEDVKRGIEAIVDVGARYPGSPGNMALERRVADLFASTGLAHGAVRFHCPVFLPGRSTLSAPGIGTIRLEAMQPTLMRPGNFPERSFTTRLVYLGKATRADLQRVKGVELKGSVALMDFDCGDAWMTLLRFGVRGFVFVGAEEYEHADSVAKLYNSEVAVARLFVPREEGERLVAACGAGGIEVAIDSESSKWETRILRDPWVLIPGSDEAFSEEVVVFTAALDANSVVPERAWGATSAMNLHLLTKLLDDFREAPPARSVMLVAINAHTRRFLGERMLAWHMSASSWDVSVLRDELAKEIRTSRLYADNYERLVLDEVDLAPARLRLGVKILYGLKSIGDERMEEAGDEELEEDDPKRCEIDLANFSDADFTEAAREAIDELEDDGLLEGEHLAPEDTRAVRELAAACESVFEDELIFESWRARLDDSTGVRLPIKGKLQDEVKRSLNRVKLERMGVSAGGADLDEAQQERIQSELAKRQADLTKVLVLFNKVDIGLGRSRTYYHTIAPNDAQRRMLKGFRDELVAKYAAGADHLMAHLKLDSANHAIREALGTKRVILAINLDLEATGEQIGFLSRNWYIWGDHHRGFGRRTCELVEELVTEGHLETNPLVDTLTNPGGMGEGHFFHSQDCAAPYFHSAQSKHSVALKTVYATHGARFGPDDRIEGLDLARVHRTEEWLRRLLPVLLSDKDAMSSDNLKQFWLWWSRPRLWSSIVRTFAMDEFGGKTVPTLEVPGCVVAVYQSDRWAPFVVDGDVINTYGGVTDRTGQLVLYAMNDPHQLAPNAYKMDDDWRRVTYAIDKGRVQVSQQMTSNIHRNQRRTVPMFPCREVPLYDRADPSLISSGGIMEWKYWVKNAVSKSDPRKYGAHGISTLSPASSHRAVGPGAVYVWRKGERFVPESVLIMTDHRRLAINATDEEPNGVGFQRASDMGADFFAQVPRDMQRLNAFRAAQMHGISNQLIDEFSDRGGKALADMARHESERDHAEYLVSSYRALGNVTKAYEQIRESNSDMLQSIIMYMALMLPFCYFLQKLLFGFKRLEYELMAFSAMFVSTYVLFRLIHPAFAIAMNPEAIFIAFVLGAIGCFTTYVLHTRFSTEMALLFNTSSGMSDLGYSVVGQTALLLGVQNMKRRRLRTSLTTGTIVLVVFTMLAFSSVSKWVNPSMRSKGEEVPYTGLFYHWPGGNPMDEQTAGAVEHMFADNADVVIRRTAKTGDSWHLERVGQAEDEVGAQVKAIIGLPVADQLFVESLPLVEGRFFSSDDAHEILLTREGAEGLSISTKDLPNVRLRMKGKDLALVGIVGDDRLRLIRDLNPNLPLVPFKNPPRREEGEDPGSLEIQDEDVGSLIMDTDAVVILPAGLAKKMGARPHSVSVRFHRGEGAPAVREHLNLFLSVTKARFYLGSDDSFQIGGEDSSPVPGGVYYVGSNYRSTVGGLSRLFIPLLIAGSIILNTLLGTVYERKSEIAIYNAIGLNPTHIFTFFLAEALVYGVLGSVGGYLIGQFMALGLKAAGAFKGVNINFSSFMVVYAILFTVGLVLLSTLYPAYVATRTAVPSGRRTWSMPKHDGQRMQIVFPFIYQPKFASGIVYYLYEYFSRFTEVSLGDQIATFDVVRELVDDDGRPMFSLKFELALAPFDLGVTQAITFDARFDELVSSYRLHLTIERLSGQDTNWVTTNKPFLAKMRKLLLHWRNVDPTQQGWYVNQGRRLLEDGPASVALDAPVAGGVRDGAPKKTVEWADSIKIAGEMDDPAEQPSTEEDERDMFKPREDDRGPVPPED